MTHDLQSLNRLLSSNRMPVSDIIRYALNIADALRRIHGDRRCHGALTPELIQVGTSGARLLAATPDALDQTTPYTAPERLRGDTLDTRTDIFSFGAVLYEMATGSRPFAAEDPEALKEEILTKEPPPADHDGLERIIRKCMAKPPAARWQKMQTVQIELKLLALAEQQSEPTIVTHMERTVNEALARQSDAIAELDRMVTERNAELTQAVTAAIQEVQSQFAEVENFLVASEQRAEHFTQSAQQATETARREMAALRDEMAGEISTVTEMAKGHASTIESIEASVACNEDSLERLVDAVEGLQNVVLQQPAAPKAISVPLAS